MNLLRAIGRLISGAERWLVVGSLSFMIVLAFIQVVLRNVFSFGFLWADPLLRHLVLWLGFLGASIATQHERHIGLDLVTRYVSPRVVSGLRIASNLFACAVSCILADAGWTFLRNEMQSHETLFSIAQLDAPAWWFQLIIPIGFGLIGVRFLVRGIVHLVEFLRPAVPAAPTPSSSSHAGT